MFNVLIARHGESEGNVANAMQGHQDSPLSRHGWRQAQALRAHLHARGHRFVRAYASDLRRAQWTAESAVSDSDVAVKTDVRLREVYFGSCEQPTTNSFLPEVDPQVFCTGADGDRETDASLQRRAASFVRRLLADLCAMLNEPDALSDDARIPSVLVASHGMFIPHLVRALLGDTCFFEFRSTLPYRKAGFMRNTGYHWFQIVLAGKSPHLHDSPLVHTTVPHDPRHAHCALPHRKAASVRLIAMNVREHLDGMRRALDANEPHVRDTCAASAANAAAPPIKSQQQSILAFLRPVGAAAGKPAAASSAAAVAPSPPAAASSSLSSSTAVDVALPDARSDVDALGVDCCASPADEEVLHCVLDAVAVRSV